MYSLIMNEIIDMRNARQYHVDMIKKIDEVIAEKEKQIRDMGLKE